MKLSSDTLAILKNFAIINPNIVFKPGKSISTISEMKNLLSSATIEEEIPLEFGIYDLNSFLSVVSMFEVPELIFDGNKKVKITEESSRTSFNYFFAEPANLTTPLKSIELPSEDVVLELSEGDLSTIRKAAGTLKAKDIVIEDKDGEAVLTLCDLKDKTANTFELFINANVIPAGCKIIFNIDNLKILNGGYTVKVSNKMIAKFEHNSKPLEYYIAVERTSKFGE